MPRGPYYKAALLCLFPTTLKPTMPQKMAWLRQKHAWLASLCLVARLLRHSTSPPLPNYVRGLNVSSLRWTAPCTRLDTMHCKCNVEQRPVWYKRGAITLTLSTRGTPFGKGHWIFTKSFRVRHFRNSLSLMAWPRWGWLSVLLLCWLVWVTMLF